MEVVFIFAVVFIFEIKMLSVVLKSKCGTAKLSLPLFLLFSCCSRYVAFVKLIHFNFLLEDVTFPLSTNQKPRKNLQMDGQQTDGHKTDGRQTNGRLTDGQQTHGRQTDGQTDRQKSDL